MPNDNVRKRRWYRRIALALLLVCGALLLIGEVAAQLPRGEAFILIAGTSLAVLSLFAAGWLLRTSPADEPSRTPALTPNDLPAIGANLALANEVHQARSAITANAVETHRLIDH